MDGHWFAMEAANEIAVQFDDENQRIPFVLTRVCWSWIAIISSRC
jgi:hypothetical protein